MLQYKIYLRHLIKALIVKFKQMTEIFIHVESFRVRTSSIIDANS